MKISQLIESALNKNKVVMVTPFIIKVTLKFSRSNGQILNELEI